MQKNKFSVGDDIEVMRPDGNDAKVKVSDMFDEKFKKIDSCPHPGQKIGLRLAEGLSVGDILRKVQ